MVLPNWHDHLDEAIEESALQKLEGFAKHLFKVHVLYLPTACTRMPVLVQAEYSLIIVAPPVVC